MPLPPNGSESFRLAVIINLTVNLEPGFLFIGREVFQNLHQVAHHLLTDSPDESRTFWSDANHHLAPVLPCARTHDIAEIFQTGDQTARGRGGMSHFLCDGGHGEDFFLVQESEKKKLRKRDVARRQFFAQMQHEAALHRQDDMGKALGVGTNLLGWISRKRGGGSGIQRA